LISAVESGIVKKSGSWYSYGDSRWQGADATKEAMEADGTLLDEIYKKTWAALNDGELPPAAG